MRCLAMIALSVLLLDETTIALGFEVTFAAFTIALVVLVAWIALAVAIEVRTVRSVSGATWQSPPVVGHDRS